ncbi:MAG TPA: DUF5724 domain-containing protein [Phycisphaerales bacterium]|nr:DUF5724 domain-containing protein [Phycisphaerales bacterium]
MMRKEDVAAKLRAMRDESWLESVPERLGHLPAEQRELIACAVDEKRRRRLLKQQNEQTPTRLRDPDLTDYEADFVAGDAILLLPESERTEVVERLAPGWSGAIEAGLRVLHRCPINSWGSVRFRSANPKHLQRLRNRWLRQTLQTLGPVRMPVQDIPAWMSHLRVYPPCLPWLVAGVIDEGGETGRRTLETLIACARGEHEIGGPDEQVFEALLATSNGEAWLCVEKVLLAAQRQEGLRQAILETAASGHPGAFARLCRVILEHDLCRFSSVVRAADTWFGLFWDSASSKVIEEAIGRALRYLEDASLRSTIFRSGSPQDVYFALWAEMFEDLDNGIRRCSEAMENKDALVRYAACHRCRFLNLDDAKRVLTRGVDDPDIRVAALAAASLRYGTGEREDGAWKTDAFAALERFLPRVPGKELKLAPAIWPWTGGKLKLEHVGEALVTTVTPETVERLVPHLSRLAPAERARVAYMLSGKEWHPYNPHRREDTATDPPTISEVARKALVGLLRDASSSVIEASIASLLGRPVKEDERGALHSIFVRKTGMVRTLAIRRALQLTDDELPVFAHGLLSAKSAEQRKGGLELLKTMVDEKRSPDAARGIAASWRASQKKLAKAEIVLLDAIGGAVGEAPRRDGAFGLINPTNLSKPMPARTKPILRMSEAAWQVLASLAAVVHRNRDFVVPRDPSNKFASDEQMLLGGERWFSGACQPARRFPLEAEWERCPVAPLLRQWLVDRADATRDADGLELLRAKLAVPMFRAQGKGSWDTHLAWPKHLLAQAKKEGVALSSVPEGALVLLLDWALRLAGDPGYAEVLVASAEAAVAAGHYSTSGRDEFDTEADDDAEEAPAQKEPGALVRSMRTWGDTLSRLHTSGVTTRTPEHGRAMWRLALASRPGAEQRWASMAAKQRSGSSAHSPSDLGIDPSWLDVFDAVEAGEATEDDLLDLMTGSYWTSEGGNVSHLMCSSSFRIIREEDEPDDDFNTVIERRAAEIPAARSAVRRLRERLIELELARGDAPTEASAFVRDINHSGGAEVCVRCLAALGKDALQRNARWSDESRQANLTHLVEVSLPGADDTPERFAALARGAGLATGAMIALAIDAPQWVRHVEHALGKGWTGFEDAVWWIHAHTKGEEQYSETPLTRQFAAAVSERTPLQHDELRDGAVDIAWFRRVIATLGEQRWAEVYALAKYACSGVGHKRAQLFADAIMNRRGATERELMARIKSKRHQDSIRALGLVPLKAGAAGKAQVLARYKLMQEVRRTSRKHGGSMLQASEKRAVDIGMENLARSAGYPDPLRLQWTMERLDLADLVKGPVAVELGDIKVTLSMDDEGAPELSAEKKGKTLASVPPAARKDKRVAGLTQRAAELKRARPRVRLALEQAMCRGDSFTAGEIAELWSHPLLRAMLRRLVLVGDERPGLAGYPEKNGKVLRSCTGEVEPLRGSDALRIAHPLDLLARKDWHTWQRECFAAERVQPFKQVFREVYVPTAAEKGASESKRYEGHQVQPRQALALLGQRGWVTRGEEGVQKTFYKERRTARLEFMEAFYTPAEVEGLTLRSLVFTAAGRWEPVGVSDVPPRVFSEAMRDLDLVVSVAHRGGVDPEASQSTVEMRAALVKETAALLKLGNVSIDGTRARIRGDLAEYSLHLGSANVQVLPGGHVWIVPIAAEHRGRLFLPFADGDPKTAEVMSKVLLLARDREIKDPSILAQIRSFA